MKKKLWYAVLSDRDDNDWGTGSFVLSEAIAMLKRDYPVDGLIAVIDGDYDEDGNATTDPVCVEEIFAWGILDNGDHADV